MKGVLKKFWEQCQRFWRWLKKEDENSLKGPKTISYYRSKINRPLIISFVIWVVLCGIVVSWPLFMLVVFMECGIIGANYVYAKFAHVEQKLNDEQQVDAKSFNSDGEPYLAYGTKKYPLLYDNEWGLRTPIIEESDDHLKRSFVALSNDADEKWVYVTEVQKISDDYKYFVSMLFYVFVAGAILGLIFCVHATIYYYFGLIRTVACGLFFMYIFYG